MIPPTLAAAAPLQNQTAPSAAELADPAHAKLWHAAQDFEAMALGALLQPMFDTVDTAHGLFGGGDGEETWRPMLTQEFAKTMAGAGGLGLAMPVYRQMLQAQETQAVQTQPVKTQRVKTQTVETQK